MKQLITAILVLSTVTIFAQEDGRLTSAEQSEISNHLNASWDQLEELVRGLSKEQWNYKSADSVWSIAEIAEHLEKSEKQLFNLVATTLKASEAVTERSGEANTKKVMEAITSRDHKVKTRPDLEPSGVYNSPELFLKNYAKLRSDAISYAKTTEDQLRHHFIPFGPLGELDGYQILMFMSGHTERHIQQIEEVMKDPSYPPA